MRVCLFLDLIQAHTAQHTQSKSIYTHLLSGWQRTGRCGDHSRGACPLGVLQPVMFGRAGARQSINSGLALPSGHASLSRGHNSRIRDGPWDAPTPPLLSLVLLTLANSIPRGADGACALWQRQDVRPSGHDLRPCLRMESSWKTVEPGMERNPVWWSQVCEPSCAWRPPVPGPFHYLWQEILHLFLKCIPGINKLRATKRKMGQEAQPKGPPS